ncbi:MAG: hypothetical protein KDD48_03295, partial [Bdellovibrionales bacterium]|nr:hypothetical protein [Bdellovibrionales bacterium]
LVYQAWIAVILAVLSCGEKRNQPYSTYKRSDYYNNRADFFNGPSYYPSKGYQKSQFLRRLYAEKFVAVDEKTGRPFYGTELQFIKSGETPAFRMILPDATTPGFPHRTYMGELYDVGIDDPGELEWIVARPQACGASEMWFEGGGFQTSHFGDVLQVALIRRCGSARLYKYDPNANSIDVIEDWLFQPFSAVRARLTIENLSNGSATEDTTKDEESTE